MADLKFVDQHNMVACLENTEENAEFHQIVDNLSTCSINYALTINPTIYASYIEQFWNTVTSKTVNSVKQIHAIVDGKAVVISESSVRSDLLFNDEDGIACLTNDEIFENLALMGYEQLSTKLTFQKENGVNILKSIDEGPFHIGTFRETLAEGNKGALHLRPERPRVYSDLSPEDKDRTFLDEKFLGKLLLKNKAVKLNRGLRDSNYDQLYAYLKQHEAHANENKMTLDRFTQHTVDPLALMSNVAPQQYNSQSSTNPSHFADNSQLDYGLSPTDNLIKNLTNTLALLTQSYKTYLPQTNNQLRTSSNPRNQAIVQDGRVVVQNVQGRQNRGQGNNARGIGTVGYGGAQNKVRNANPCQARQVKCCNCNARENGVVLDEEQLLFLACGQDNVVDEDVDEQPVQDLALNVDNVFQADDCDAFDSNVDEAPTAQTMFMANLSFADLVYDEAGSSYDSDILSEVHDYDHYQDAVCKHHEEHVMHDDVQPNYVEQVELYERRARFELTEIEQKIDEQLRIVITDRNIKKENLKKEIHSVKLQLASTINHNKSMVEEVTSLKKDFKQKENKYLEEFLDMKALKEKVEDKLYKQDQSLQTIHMLCKLKPYYDEQNKVPLTITSQW
ncbi:hypothetical protein Tco_1143426 [Tanacetum coccineum]